MSEEQKQKRYYWLKLKKDFFKRHDIEIIEAMENGKDYVLFYLKLLLESIDHEGRLRFSDTIPYSLKMLSTVTHTNIDTVRNALEVLASLDLIEVWDDSTLFMKGVSKLIGSETPSAERMRRKRAKDGVALLEQTGKTSQCDTDVTFCDTDVRKSKSIDNRDIDINNPPIIPPTGDGEEVEKPKKKSSTLDPAYDEPFQVFWDSFPRRRRGAKQECRRKYENAIKNNKGLTPEKMLEALEKQKRSKDWTKDKGEYVPSPLTWLNQGRWEDEVYEDNNDNGTTGYVITEQDRLESL